MKNELAAVGIVGVVIGLATQLSTLNILGTESLLAGLIVVTMAIFLRVLPRQIATINPNISSYSFDTDLTYIEDDLMRATIQFDSNRDLRPTLAEREVILCPPDSDPMNWVDTPARVSTDGSITYNFVDTEHGDSDIKVDEIYGKFNAQLTGTPSHLEAYDYFTNKKVGEIPLED